MTPRGSTCAARRRHALLATAAVLAVTACGSVAASSSRAGPPPSPQLRSLFPTTEPEGVQVRRADQPVRVGTRFRAHRAGWVYGVRFWKDESSAGRHVGTLWSKTGKRLARVVFTAESGRGWQRGIFASPVSIRADRTYIVSNRSTDGRYVVAPDYPRVAQSPVLELAGARSALVQPTTQSAPAWRSGAVFVDVLFAPAPTTGPQPTDGPTSGTTVTASASLPPGTTPTSSTSLSTTSTPTSTLTSTPSPAPNATCKSVPSSCGYPDGTNTGPRPGTVFTRVPAQATSGPGWYWHAGYDSIFVTGAGTVLDSLDVAGAVVIDAPNVTLSNSRITSCGGADDTDVVAVRYKQGDPAFRGSNARIIDNLISGSPAGCTHRARSGIRDVYGQAPDVVVDGNDISGTGNGITIEYQGLVTDNWIHDLGHLAGDHHSGLSTHGGALQVTYRHNTVLLYGASYPGGGGLSGAITVYSDFGHAQNTTIEDNFISGGSYVIYGGNSGDSYTTPATGIKIRGNRFACPDWLYGPVGMFTRTSPGNEWSLNYCDATGAVVNP